MPQRVLIAGLFHETHTFLDQLTGFNDFRILRGEEMLACEGDGSPLGGALEAGRRFGWEILPTGDYRAQPSGLVSDEVFEQFWADFHARAEGPLRQGAVDAIYLVLHGAMVTSKLVDAEGEFLARLRALNGANELPLFGVFDLHANFTARMAGLSHCLVAYRTNPHADACAMAIHAADLLEKWFQRRESRRHHPQTFCRHSGLMWPPMGTGTDDSPMRDLESLARQFEAQYPEILAVNVVGGFSHADTPDSGVSFSVVVDRSEKDVLATHVLNELCARAWELRHAGNVVDEPIADILARLANCGPGLTVIAEPSDNIGGGAPGDGTGLLRAFVEYNVANSAVCLADPVAVGQLQSLPIGESMRLALGGRGSRLDSGPYPLEVTLVSRSDGRFRLEDRQSHLASMFGHEFDMGACAVVRHRGVTILLTSRKCPPFDLGQWRSQGIEPTRLSVVGVKAAVAHRKVYRPIAARLWTADTPGPCRSDVRTFHYEKIRRPIFPLDGCSDGLRERTVDSSNHE